MRWKRETYAEREKRRHIEMAAWKIEYDKRIAASQEWHEVYAWWPRYTEDGGLKMWLETVLRKQKGWTHKQKPRWVYRPITLLETDVKPEATINAEN